MSVTLYDRALLRKIQYWVKDPNITILGVDQSTDLFKYRLDMNNDKPLSLPIISLSRDSNIVINSVNKKPLTYDGLKVESANMKTNQLNAIPISIRYQLDVYTRYDEEAQEYMRNFIFNFINYPKVDLEIPYNNSKLIMNAYISIDNQYNDNSNIPEKLIRDQFSRQTLSFTLNGSLYDYRAYDNWKIDCSQLVLLLREDELATGEGSIDIKTEGDV